MAQRSTSESKRCIILFYFSIMTKTKIFFILGILWLVSIPSTNAYLLWLKSADNTIENIQTIEQKHSIRIPLVGFIFDPRGSYVINTINQLSGTLGITRIYHITLSPNMFSAAEVADGKFDEQYKQFFQTVKDNNLRVVFRTMHEMNGGRYPWSSHPENFKKARIHVRNLSREVGLSTNNILFDFSVNHRDMPTKQTPSQTAKLIPCQVKNKEKLGCYTFEDYYPGDEYVDLIWFTFYNRGKGSSDRKRLTPTQIVYEKWREPLKRIKAFEKPIIIDEVGTTAVWYTGDYNYKISKEIYKKNYELKNTWLRQLQQLLWKESDIVGAVYFNVDYTNGLTKKLIWEADWSVINLVTNKVYKTFFTILNNSDDLHLRSPLLNIFGVGTMNIKGIEQFISLKLISKIRKIQILVNKLWKTPQEREKIQQSLWIKDIRKIFPDISEKEIEEIKEIVKK